MEKKPWEKVGLTEAQYKEVQLQAKLELCRRDFWTFCKTLAPDFYMEGRDYLKEFCYALQEFYETDERVLIINMPPRHGKSRTAGLFAQWIFGRNPAEKIITGSYNEQLSTTFSRGVRNAINERKASKEKIVYSDIFPRTYLKKGSSAANLWTLEGQHISYLATSPGGTVTGFGATVMILDDIVKNAEEAMNETVLENHWTWFCFTGDTLIKTTNGDKKIKDIGIGDKVLTFNHSQCIIEEKEVVRTNNHLDSIYRLEFDNGQTVECTGNHKFYTNRGYLSIEEILSIMRCSVEEGQAILFSDLQEQSTSRKCRNDNLPELWKRNSVGEKEQADEVLFCGLQERVSSETSDQQICWLGEIERQFENRVSEMSTVWDNEKSSSPSHRSRYEEQQSGQSNCALPIMSYRLSQITRVPSNELHRVYDIEVADNHNFFANGMLVHNCNTMLSRLEKNGKLVIIATRWNTKDLSGRAIEHYKSIGMPCKVITKKALQDDGTMLCDGVLDRQAYDLIVKTMGREIVEANYNQNPIDLVGRLYNLGFQTYKALPTDDKGQSVVEEVCAYVDTADQGDDYLCCIIYALYRQQCYVLDVYFTKEGMEITEGEVAKRLHDFKVNRAFIESNNGGRGFGRSVERILREKYHWYKTYIDLFTQSKNKKSRILSSATWCQNNIKFPIGWEVNFSEFYGDVMGYQKEGKMAHDDAEDCLAGVYDRVGRGNLFSFD